MSVINILKYMYRKYILQNVINFTFLGRDSCTIKIMLVIRFM